MPRPNFMGRKSKILVLGSAYVNVTNDELRIESFKWQDLTRVRNIQDYDAVIFDLFQSPDLSGLDVRLATDIFTREKCWEMLRARTQLFVLGDPRTTMPDVLMGGQPFSSRTGFEFKWGASPGDIVSISSETTPQMVRYLQAVKKWDWAIARVIPFELPDRGDHWRWRFEQINLATNKLGNAIATRFELVLEHEQYNGFGMQWFQDSTWGSLNFLPDTSMQHEETIHYILREFLGVKIAADEPEWTRQLSVPGEETILRRIHDEETAIQQHSESLERLRQERKQERTTLKLLYDLGESLEEVVRETFRSMGATVTVAKEKGKADGFLSVLIGTSKYHAVLEIKGTKAEVFSQDGLKQLSGWIHEGAEEHGLDYKGIFIGNAATDKPPGLRPSPFPDSWIRTAKLRKIAALRSEDLYTVLLRVREGALPTSVFWQHLFKTDGVFDLKSVANVSQKAV